jgi:DNA-binding SARP family transcriptional activator
MIQFRTLGTIELSAAGGASVGNVLHHPKRLALLAYLCTPYPPRRHSRDMLVALLWPELDEAHARGALRQELYQLRLALGPNALHGQRTDPLGINPEEIWCDAQEFEAALDGGRPDEALGLWRGEFLPGVHVAGGEFERWLDQERDRLFRRALEGASQLSASAESAGDRANALCWARRLTELAPYDETFWQRLMLLLDRHGDRAGALRAFDSMAGRLRADLEVEPSPETHALIERIRDRGQPFAPIAASATQLAGPGLRSRKQRAVIGLQPVENQTGNAALDRLARLATDRLAQALAGAMFVDVAASGDAGGTTAVASATLYGRGELVEVVPRLAQPGPDGRLVEMPRSVTFSPDAPGDALDVLAAHVLASVAAHYDPRFDAAATPDHTISIPTPLWEAYLEYLQGSDLFGQYRSAEGYQHLRRAYEIDPGFAKAGIFAAIALAEIGEPAAADSLASTVMASARPLSDYERLFGEWFLAVLHGRRADAYRSAMEGILASSSPVISYLAAREALYLRCARQAARLLEGIEYGQGWWRNRSEIVEVRGGTYHVLGEHGTELAAVLEGRAVFPASHQPLRAEVRARAALGECERVQQLVDEVLTLPQGLGSPADVAWVAAQELDAHGHEPAGARVRRVALEWLEGRTSPSLAERQLQVRLLLETGEVAAAGRALSALAPFLDLESVGLAGLVAAHAGDTATARQILAQLQALQNPYLSGRHLLFAAGIQALLDPPAVAITTLRRAFADGLPFTVELHALPSLRPLARCPEFRQLLMPRG